MLASEASFLSDYTCMGSCLGKRGSGFTVQGRTFDKLKCPQLTGTGLDVKSDRPAGEFRNAVAFFPAHQRGEPVVTLDELLELLRLHRRLTGGLVREVKMRHLPSDCLIPPDEFRQMVAFEQHTLALHRKAEKKRNYPGYGSLRSLSPKRRGRMLELLESLVSSMDELGKHIHGWVDRAAREAERYSPRA